MRSGVTRTVLRSHASLRHMAPTYSAVAPRAAIVPPRRVRIIHWHASPRGCANAAHRPRRAQGPFPPQYSMLPSVIVQAALSIAAATAPAIQAAASVTFPAPTATISAPSAAPSFVTAAECRTNFEVVEPTPTDGLPIIGLPPQLPKLAGPLIGLECSPIVPGVGSAWCVVVWIGF